MKTDAVGSTGSCATTTIAAPGIETTAVNSTPFVWETIIAPDFVPDVYDVPAIAPTNSDSIFCSNSTCDKSCTIYAPNGKIYICHVPPGDPGNPQQLILPLSAVNAHLSQHPEDRVGICGQNCSNVTFRLNTNKVSTGEALSKPAVNVIIYPNPTSTSFSLRLNGALSKPLVLNVISLDGRVVYNVQKPSSLNEINFGHNLLPGTYFVEIRFSDKREVFKVVKLK
jgi:hypothetical protein